MKKRIARTAALLAGLVVALAFGNLAPADSTEPPVLTVAPGSYAFGPINIGGELGEPGDFILSNEGATPVELLDARTTGPNSRSFIILPYGSSCYDPETDGILEQGESCNIVVIFDPVVEGPNEASLRIDSDSKASPDLLSLTGTGLPELLPEASLEPGKVDFGSQQIGVASEIESIRLTSSGTGDLGIGPVMIAGDHPGDFEVTSNKCSGRFMASGDSCEIQVRFQPTRTGVRDAEIRIVTDSAGADPAASLTGTGSGGPLTGTSRIVIGAELPRIRRSGLQPVPLRCITAGMDVCRGNLRLEADGRVLGRRTYRRVTIASVSFGILPGRKSVGVKLGRQARRILSRRGKLPVRVVVTSRQADDTLRRFEARRKLRR